ncbi:hypothetical protein G7046_g2394 [Stylonectria norvegica]|nr:hypothetical protein G7046_g2394 [Stylonectria norvegica]
MVALEDIRSSNSLIGTALRAGLVAVFAGATSGIGETSLKEFAKTSSRPRIYFIGRSNESGSRILKELQELNPGGEDIYKSVDVSQLCSVDSACHEIKDEETAINLLFLNTDEGLNYPVAVSYYARLRFIINFLPLLQNATDLKRVVTVLAGTKEGVINMSNFQGRNGSMLALRGHFSSMMTFALEAIAEKAPRVSFIHVYPGFVKTNYGNDVKGPIVAILRAAFNAAYPLIGPLMATPINETGECHVFFATSARFPAGEQSGIDGVPTPKGIVVARGTNGNRGSGVYSIGNDGETARPKVEQLLGEMREHGTVQKVWLQIEEDFVRITGAPSI